MMDTQAFTKDDHQGKTPKQGGSVIFVSIIYQIFALTYVSVTSKCYHPRGNPRANFQELSNTSSLGNFFGLIPGGRAYLEPLILTNFTHFTSFKTLIINFPLNVASKFVGITYIYQRKICKNPKTLNLICISYKLILSSNALPSGQKFGQILRGWWHLELTDTLWTGILWIS